jgi:hypothetical protein
MWRKRRQPESLLVEVIPSRWDDEPVERSRSMLAGLAGVGGFSLEFAATEAGLRFYIRAASGGVADSVLDQLRAAYPQAELRRVPITDRPDLDPARRVEGEACATLALRLQREAALPLATDQRRGDGLLGVLAATASAGAGERVVSQFVVGPAPSGWADAVRSREVLPERGRGRETPPNPAMEILPLLALLGLGAVGLRA